MSTYNLVSPCISGPCENGGECLNVGDYFECKCLADYSGKLCQDKGMKKYHCCKVLYSISTI